MNKANITVQNKAPDNSETGLDVPRGKRNCRRRHLARGKDAPTAQCEPSVEALPPVAVKAVEGYLDRGDESERGLRSGNGEGREKSERKCHSERQSRSGKGRIYVGGAGAFSTESMLEGDPQNYKDILRRIDDMVSSSQGKTSKKGRVRGDNRRLPKAGLADWEPQRFSLIYSYEDDKKRASWSEMWRFLLAQELVKAVPDDSGFARIVYNNPDTGIQAQFLGYAPQNPGEVGIEFSMDLPQPQCVAHEVLPLAVRLSREFHVAMQVRHGNRAQEVTATQEALLGVWRELVAEERCRLTQQGEQFFPVRSAAVDSVWEYQLLREELQYANRNNDCAFLAVEFVCRKRTGEVLRMCRWTELMPAVFPPVDLIMLVDPPKPLGNGRIYEAAELFAKGKEWIKTEPFPVPHKMYVRGAADEGFVQLLSKMKGATMRSFTGVEWQRLDDR